MMLSLDTAYRSFGGEVEASSTPTICRLSDSRRHQLSAIARSLNRLFLDRPSLLIGICDFMPPCGRCQLYGCSQIASSSALSSILEWFDVGRRSTTLDHWTPFFPALGISQSV